MTSTLLRNARVMTCDPDRPGLGVIERGSVALRDGRIEWVGEGNAADFRAELELDAKGALVTPGLIDCHTHAVFGGDRGAEFEMRAAGNTYQDIAAAGGGINATLGPTRVGLENGELERQLVARLAVMLRGGSTTIEIKTGYALTTDGELGLLRTIDNAAGRTPARLIPTLLAHLVPPDRQADRGVFVKEICDEWIPQATAAQAVDVWCEDAAFTIAETRQILAAATRAGKAVRGHVGQLSDVGGVEVFAQFGARSVDHLEFVSDEAIHKLADAGTVAVMLPGACVQLRLPVPPVAKLRAAHVAMAIATDLNPGTSWSEHLPLQMWLATTHFQMTIEEAWLGVTRHAARVLALGDVGAIVKGARADLVLWRCERPVDVCYRMGPSLVDRVIVAGQLVD